MLYFGLIKAELVPIVVATILSTALVLLLTGHTHQIVSKGNKKLSKRLHSLHKKR